ncbi:MAG: glycosyltransferase family 2 protein [Actinomycetia bacterium]|nr:glycosyltransferase family 2 protein [Actinomycetes bacterium]
MIPDISFVIPAYNAEQTIEAAISSALAQVDVSVEVVVVDDASHDQTAAIASSFGAPVRVLRNEVNLGEGRSRQRAIEAARGRWLAVLDADDKVAPKRSRRLIACAESLGLPIAVDNVRMHRYDAAEQDGRHTHSWLMFSKRRLAGTASLNLEQFVRGSRPLRSWSEALGYLKPILRRDFVETHALRYDSDLKIGADFYFLARALHFAGAAAVEPHGGYHYTIYPDSVSAHMGADHVEAMIEADAAIQASLDLTSSERDAFEERSALLREALEYVRLTSLVRQRDWDASVRHVVAHPRLLSHLHRPLWWRVKRRLAPIVERFPRRSRG